MIGIVYKEPKNYDDFVKILKGLKTDKQKISYIMEYFKRQVNFNYEYLTFAYLTDVNGFKTSAINAYACEIDKETTNNGEYTLPNAKEREKNLERLLAKMKKNFPESAELSEQTKQKILSEYGAINSANKLNTLNKALINGQPKRMEEKNGLLTLGVCADFYEFLAKLLSDLGIEFKKVVGNTGKAFHAWLIISVDGKELCYDPTYAIYARDNYNDWAKKAKWEDFVGVTNEHIKKLNPTRTILEVSEKNKKTINLE